jgi:putative endonuclease
MWFFSGKRDTAVAKRLDSQNISVLRGVWGEDIAADFLKRKGWRIVGRNLCPCKRDRRKEIDIVAYIREENTVVFVEVKTHKTHPDKAPRAWGVDRAKKRNLLAAFRAWLRSKKWTGNYRFDILEIYGDGLDFPEIDHLVNVPIFPPSDRFFKYG